MDKPISFNMLYRLYELYEQHCGGFTSYNAPFGQFLGWIGRIQHDTHEGAGHCSSCKLAWSILKA